MSNKNFGISGKGYYIALILFAAAIGISGYLYYQNANRVREVSLQDEIVEQVVITVPTQAARETAPAPSEAEQTKPAPTTPAAPAPTEPKAIRTAAPVSGEQIGSYCVEALSYNETTRDWRVHNGIDLAAQEGEQVFAAADGTVSTTYEDDTMGYTVVIRHQGGYTTQYSNLSSDLLVSAGDAVNLGQPIGYVGNTALIESAMDSHVHFCVSYQDSPISPEEFLALN